VAFLETDGVMEKWNNGSMGEIYNFLKEKSTNLTFHHSILPAFQMKSFGEGICLVS
jgi:hypothetical protein